MAPKNAKPHPSPPPPVGVIPADRGVASDRRAGVMPADRGAGVMTSDRRAGVMPADRRAGVMRSDRPAGESTVATPANPPTGIIPSSRPSSVRRSLKEGGFSVAITEVRDPRSPVLKSSDLQIYSNHPVAVGEPSGSIKPIPRGNSQIGDAEAGRLLLSSRLASSTAMFKDPLRLPSILDPHCLESFQEIKEYASLCQKLLSNLRSCGLSEDFLSVTFCELKDKFGNLDPVCSFAISMLESGYQSFNAYYCCYCTRLFSDFEMYNKHISDVHIMILANDSKNLIPDSIREEWIANLSDWNPLGQIPAANRAPVLDSVGKLFQSLYRKGILTESHRGAILELGFADLDNLPCEHKTSLYLASHSSEWLRYLPWKNLLSVLHFLSVIDNCCLVDGVIADNFSGAATFENVEYTPKFSIVPNAQSILIDVSTDISLPMFGQWLYRKPTKNYRVVWNTMLKSSSEIMNKLAVQVGLLTTICKDKGKLTTCSSTESTKLQILKMDAQIMALACNVKKLQNMLATSSIFDYEITLKELLRAILQRRLELHIAAPTPEIAPCKGIEQPIAYEAQELIPLMGSKHQCNTNEAPSVDEIANLTPLDGFHGVINQTREIASVKSFEQTIADEVSETTLQRMPEVGDSSKKINENVVPTVQVTKKTPAIETAKHQKKGAMVKTKSKPVLKPSTRICQEEALEEMNVTSDSSSTAASSYEPDQQVNLEHASMSPPVTRSRTKMALGMPFNVSRLSESNRANGLRGNSEVGQIECVKKKRTPRYAVNLWKE